MATQRDPNAPNPIHEMVQQAHAGETDVAAPPQGDSSAPPIQSEQVAPRQEATSSPEEPAPKPDPEASKVRRLAEQRDKARSEAEAVRLEKQKLEEQLRELNGQRELSKLLKETTVQPEYDEDEQRLLKIAQAGAKYGYEQAMAGLDAAGLQRLTVKEQLRNELGEDLSNSQLDAITEQKWSNRGLTAEQAKVLATYERPELFDLPGQEAAEIPPSLPASHRVQKPTGESRAASQPKEPSTEEQFLAARQAGNRRGMRKALNQHLIKTMIAPAWGVSDDGTGRVHQRAERQHFRSPRKG